MNIASPRQIQQTLKQQVRSRRAMPVLVLLGSIAIAILLYATRPQLVPHAVERAPVAVRFLRVDPGDRHIVVRAQGTVEPRTESELVPEVSGRVVWTSPALVSGGRFDAGETLLRIDDSDYRNALARAEAAQKRARADAEYARFENERLAKLQARDLASRSLAENALRATRVADAALQEAVAAVERARLDVERTVMRAPYAGRVRSEAVDIGQMVSRGDKIAMLYATDYVELRLPLADQQLAFLDPVLMRRGVAAMAEAPPVRLYADFAGRSWEWQGRIVRTEGEIDPRSRMVHVIARVENPEGDGHQSLPVGLFVNAEIRGELAHGVIELPRAAMRDDNRVLVIDAEDRLRFREVELLRIERDVVLVRAGLEAGERVSISPLQAVVDGMPVTPLDEATLAKD